MKSLCGRIIGGLGAVAVLLAVAEVSAVSQTASRPHPARTSSAAGPANAAQKYKGIWEPKNYPDDVHIEDVYFANEKVGWAAGRGAGGFLLHTTDGGEHWDLQLGDPHSNTPEVNRLRFLDATHGWAMQGGQLIRTMDGTTWQTIGPLPGRGGFAGGSAGYQFTSVQDGFEIAGDSFGAAVYATHDGGHSWKPVYECTATLQVNGLTRATNCVLNDLRFVSRQVAYAVGGGENWAAIAKTTDGGSTWKLIYAATDVPRASTVFFTDENNGVVRLWDSRVLITADGGQNWRGATGIAQATIKFADPEVGLSCAIDAFPSCAFSQDGGKSWTSHNFNFPVAISGYSFPRRDRIYVVGDHGMIYRYRVVPADYNAQGILDAPLMPGYGGPIVDRVQDMQTQVASLRAQLGAASSVRPPRPVTANGPTLQTVSYNPGDALPSPQFQQSAPPATASVQAPAPGGGFSQDASAGGFVQDTAEVPPGPFVQNCCATQVQSLQTSFTSFSQQVPTFSGQFRNLNLLVVGLNMFSDLLSKGKQIGTAFTALKKAPDAQTALAALENLSTSLESTSQAITSQFQNLTAAPGMGGLGGPINALQSPGMSAPAPAAAPDPNQAAGTNSNPVASTTAQKTQKALDKLKKKIPW